MFWEDESDSDLLSVLPPLEGFPAVPLRPPSVPPQRRHKKTKKIASKRTGGLSAGGIKKASLRAGLFSFDFKSPEDSTLGSSSSLTRLKSSIVYRPEEHPFSLLPPPYYCGRQLRQKREDFTLPFDIWALHASGVLPTRDVLATWNYKRIKSNIYYDARPSAAAAGETPACHCKWPADRAARGCTDNCINRLTYTECDPASCPLGAERCANMAIQKHLSSAAVERFMTLEKGWGIRVRSPVPAGTFIMEYLGEVVSDREFKRRMLTDYQKDSHHYCLYLGEGMVIDGHRMGGECRFVNHSCKPNCEMQKWSVNGQYRMALFSTKDLASNEELTYDYNFSLFNPHEGQECRCGMPACRGVIGGKSQRVALRTGAATTAALAKSGQSAREGGGRNSTKGTAPGAGERKRKEKSRSVSATLEKREESSDPAEMPAPKETETVAGSTVEPSAAVSVVAVASSPAPIKAMSAGQQAFCRRHSVLLVRNLARVRRLREHYLGHLQQQQQLAGAAPRLDVPPSNRETGGGQESAREMASSPLHRNVAIQQIPITHCMLLKMGIICIAHLFRLIWFIRYPASPLVSVGYMDNF